MSSLTATLAVLLTVNMIIERREFLEMLTKSEESRGTLSREFKTALVAIQRLTTSMRDAERLETHDVRRLAAEINRTTDQLDRMVEEMLATSAVDGGTVRAPKPPTAGDAVVVPSGI